MKRSSRWRRRLGRLLLLSFALVVLAAVCALVIRFAPPWLVSTKGLTGTARLNELSRVRVALVVLILGALAGALALYLLRSSAGERREENRERLLIERFMRAVDQLGHPALDVRLGGIYSLERLARESPEHHPPIIEILAAFVREHAPWPGRAAGRAGNGARPGGGALGAGHAGDARPRPPTDVQAALTILGRRLREQDTDAPLFLSYTALAGATLTGAHLERALLSGASLEGADLFKANLGAADLEGTMLRGAGLLLANLNDTVLWGANLEGARLYGANLEGAALKGANLKDAGLTGANLKDAGLHGAVLTGADLTGANLEGAGLEGANLEGANLQGANLRGAVLLNALYDEATAWPGGFDVAAQGAVRRAWPHEPAPASTAWMQEAEQPARQAVVGWPHEVSAARSEPTTHESYELPAVAQDAPAPVHEAPAPVHEAPAPAHPEPAVVSEEPAAVHEEPAVAPEEPAALHEEPRPDEAPPAYESPASYEGPGAYEEPELHEAPVEWPGPPAPAWPQPSPEIPATQEPWPPAPEASRAPEPAPETTPEAEPGPHPGAPTPPRDWTSGPGGAPGAPGEEPTSDG